MPKRAPFGAIGDHAWCAIVAILMTVMPIGATILYSSIAAVFVAQIFNVDLSLGQQLAMLGALMVTSKRASA